MFSMRNAAWVVALAVAIASADAAASQSDGDKPVTDDTVFGAWKVTCAEGGDCQAFLSLVDKDTNQRALTASFHFIEGSATPTGVVVLPLGVALRPGVRIASDESGAGDRPIELTPEVCFPDGCRAVFNLSSDKLAQILSADAFSVRFFPYSEGAERPILLSVPTDGLSNALDYIVVRQQ